jgi:hypothetical protein
VRDGFLREIKSPLILQPGPAALTDGLAALEAIIVEWSTAQRRAGWSALADLAQDFLGMLAESRRRLRRRSARAA